MAGYRDCENFKRKPFLSTPWLSFPFLTLTPFPHGKTNLFIPAIGWLKHSLVFGISLNGNYYYSLTRSNSHDFALESGGLN
jgi:hypothetical protein